MRKNDGLSIRSSITTITITDFMALLCGYFRIISPGLMNGYWAVEWIALVRRLTISELSKDKREILKRMYNIMGANILSYLWHNQLECCRNSLWYWDQRHFQAEISPIRSYLWRKENHCWENKNLFDRSF